MAQPSNASFVVTGFFPSTLMFILLSIGEGVETTRAATREGVGPLGSPDTQIRKNAHMSVISLYIMLTHFALFLSS